MKGSRNHVLLVEILIAVLFFALCGTTVLQVYAAAGRQSHKAGRTDDAVRIASDTAERLYAAGAGAEVLAELGFEEADGVWEHTEEVYTVRAIPTEQPAETGVLRSITVSVLYDDEILIELPCTRYVSGEVVP